MIINHNMNAMNAHRQMTGNVANAGKSMEKLSSGLRINRAGDDAAGLAISEKMRGQIRGLDQSTRNSQDGISMIQTAEGALNETHSILQRMRELATQAANDTNNKEDRGQIQEEMNQLTSEINRIGNTTEFNTQKVLDGGEAARKANSTGSTGSTGSTTAAAATPTQTTGTSGNVKITDGTKYSGTVDAKWKLETTDGTTFTLDKGDGAGAKPVTFTSNKVTVDGVEIDMTGITAAANDAWEISVSAAKTGTTGSTANQFTATLQIGANEGQAFKVSIADMRAVALGISNAVTGSTGSTGSTTAAAATPTQTTGTSGNVKITDGTKYSGTVDAKWKLETTDGTTFTLDKGDGAGAKPVTFTSNKVTVDGVEIDMTGITAAANDAWEISVSAAKTGSTGSTTFATNAKVTNGTTDTAVEAALDMSSHESATAAIKVLDTAINTVSTERSKLGAYQNRLEHTIANLGTSSENLQAAESRVRDVDMAKEMMAFSKNNILSQASQAMLAQAKSQPEAVLQLLR